MRTRRSGFPAAAIVLAYKGLSHAERGFRDLKSGDLDVRPIHHRRAHRVRAHVFLCMLAYYVIWHMKRDLAPMLFKDDNPAKAKVSPAARRKAARKRTEDGQPVHSFRTLLSRGRAALIARRHGWASIQPKAAPRWWWRRWPIEDPRAAAGLRHGDILASVRGAESADLGDFYRKVWR